MKKIILIVIFLYTYSFTPSAYGQDEEFQKQIEEIMKAREEMLNSLMNGNGDIEKKMQEMLKRFSQQGGLSDFDFDEFGDSKLSRPDWIINDLEKTLVIKVKQIKDRPLEFKIEKGILNIKGDIEGTQGAGKNKFEQSISLPDDIDQSSPEYENKEGEVRIKFKRLLSTKSKKKVSPVKTVTPKKSDERLPVAPSTRDTTI